MEDGFAKIVVGQRLWAKVNIPSDGYILPEKKSEWSTVTRDIVGGKAVLKHLVVLKHNGDHLVVAYVTSFGKSKDLASHVTEVKDWYPVAPAAGSYTALPEEPLNKSQTEDSKKVHAWYNLKHILQVRSADKYTVFEGLIYDEDSITKLKAAIDLRTGQENF